MKKIFVLMLIGSLFFIVSCGKNETFDKAMDEAKIAFVSKEYEKAEGLLKLANDEKKDNEAKALYEQVKAFRNIKENSVWDKLEEESAGFELGENFLGLSDVMDKIQIIEGVEVESNIVVDELDDVYIDVQIEVMNMVNLFNEFIKKLYIEAAEEYLIYIRRVDEYDFKFMEECNLDVKAFEKSLEDAKKLLNDIENNSDGYLKEEVNEILSERFGKSKESGASVDNSEDNNIKISGEVCYTGSVFWDGGNRLRNFYVGSQRGTIYNGMQEFVGYLQTFEIGDIEY